MSVWLCVCIGLVYIPRKLALSVSKFYLSIYIWFFPPLFLYWNTTISRGQVEQDFFSKLIRYRYHIKTHVYTLWKNIESFRLKVKVHTTHRLAVCFVYTHTHIRSQGYKQTNKQTVLKKHIMYDEKMYTLMLLWLFAIVDVVVIWKIFSV